MNKKNHDNRIAYPDRGGGNDPNFFFFFFFLVGWGVGG